MWAATSAWLLSDKWCGSASRNRTWAAKVERAKLFCEGDQPWANIRANPPLFAEEDRLWANIYCQSSASSFFPPKPR